ncbi:MAG: hypothetical protein JWN01_1133 [Patescibacteria group bacterium]|nr:hypothetical protein [Patescibacteria group bacterium]
MGMSFIDAFHFAATTGACAVTKTGFLKVGIFDGLTCNGNDVMITSANDILLVLANVTKLLIAAVGAVAVIIIIVAGIYYITSAGDPGRIKRAKDIITNTAVGLVIISTAYAVVWTIAKGF